MKGHTQKWNQLENMLFETPEKMRAPHSTKASSTKASSKGYPSNNRTYKFISAKNNDYALPRSLNVIRNISSPDKIVVRDDSDGSIENTLKIQDPHAAVGSFNYLEDDLETQRMGLKTAGSVPKRSKFTLPSTRETIIIRTGVSSTRRPMKMDCASMNQLDKVYRITEPVCGIDECHFQLLFRKKCQVCYLCLD